MGLDSYIFAIPEGSNPETEIKFNRTELAYWRKDWRVHEFFCKQLGQNECDNGGYTLIPSDVFYALAAHGEPFYEEVVTKLRAAMDSGEDLYYYGSY